MGSLPSPGKTWEEGLYQCIMSIDRNRTNTCGIAGGAIECPTAFSRPIEYLDRGNGASANIYQRRGFKPIGLKVVDHSMRPQRGPIGKQRRRSSKGNIKVYKTDPTNFRALVYQHTSMHPSSPTSAGVDVPASPLTSNSITSTPSPLRISSQPVSPLTPNSITSTASPLRFLSLPASPDILSGPASPFLSPHKPPPSGFYSNSSLQPDLSSHVNYVHSSHLDTSGLYSSLQGPNPYPAQSTRVSRCASTPCLDVLNKCDEVPINDNWPHGTSASAYARSLSLDKFMMEENSNIG